MYSYDRHGNIVEIKVKEKMTEEEQNSLDLLKDYRGIYKTKEEATNAYEMSKPQWVATGPNSGYWD